MPYDPPPGEDSRGGGGVPNPDPQPVVEYAAEYDQQGLRAVRIYIDGEERKRYPNAAHPGVDPADTPLRAFNPVQDPPWLAERAGHPAHTANELREAGASAQPHESHERRTMGARKRFGVPEGVPLSSVGDDDRGQSDASDATRDEGGDRGDGDA
jgi:hypothetical protein